MISSLGRARVRAVGSAALLLVLPLVAGCSAISAAGRPRPADTWVQGSSAAGREESAVTAKAAQLLPGMPPPLVPDDLYAADRPNDLSEVVRHDKSLVYVPNLDSNTVTVIDPRTYQVLRTVPVGKGPQHVVPAWDLKTLWVNDDTGNALTPINPVTGAFGKAVRVEDP